MDKKPIRAFIAIDFPRDVMNEVGRVQALIKKKKFTGKATELENLHLTLKFLGEIDEEKLNKVREKLRGIKFGEMDLKLGRTGIFSFRKNPRIVWIKIKGKQIWELQKKIDSALKGLFKPEERFMGHLTIARVKHVNDRKGFAEYVRSIKPKEMNFKIKCFKLISSKLERTGPVYEDIEEYNLGV